MASFDANDGVGKGKAENDPGLFTKAVLDIASISYQVIEDSAEHVGIQLTNDSDE